MHKIQTNTREPLFPRALKKARLAGQFKQETLAARLYIKPRTLVSWETGTRIPSVGMVALLSQVLTDRFDLESDLMLAYVADDLARQTYLQEDEELHRLAIHILEQIQAKEQEQKRPSLSLFVNQLREGYQEYNQERPKALPQEQQHEDTTSNSLQQLFTVLDTLREHTELLPVVQDFLHEVTAQSE